MEQTDEQLVALAIDGDQDAFGNLVVRWESRMLRVAAGLIRDEEEARDLCQEAFLRAYRAIKGFKGEATFGTWINRITKNLCFDWIKKRRPPVGPISDVESAGAIDPKSLHDTIEDRIARGELKREMEKVLARLPDKNREAVKLKHYHDLTYEEIADLKGWPVGTVKTLVYQGLRMMTELLQERATGHE